MLTPLCSQCQVTTINVCAVCHGTGTDGAGSPCTSTAGTIAVTGILCTNTDCVNYTPIPQSPPVHIEPKN